jgi:hypothetical protein
MKRLYTFGLVLIVVGIVIIVKALTSVYSKITVGDEKLKEQIYYFSL